MPRLSPLAAATLLVLAVPAAAGAPPRVGLLVEDPPGPVAVAARNALGTWGLEPVPSALPPAAGLLAIGAAAPAAMAAAGGRPTALIEPACAALEVPRPGPVLVLTGAAALAACPPQPAWAGLEIVEMPRGLGDDLALRLATDTAAAWLCLRVAACTGWAP